MNIAKDDSEFSLVGGSPPTPDAAKVSVEAIARLFSRHLDPILTSLQVNIPQY